MRRVAFAIPPLLLAAAPAAAQRQNIYDAQGRYQGHTERNGTRSQSDDGSGRYTGTTGRGPAGTRSFDGTGTFTGSTSR